MGRIAWSTKNVREERDAPQQLLMRAMDSRFCVLLNLGLWMEYNLEAHPIEGNNLVFKIDGTDDTMKIKHIYMTCGMSTMCLD